jgi:tRNA1(Val) A37 N6-methylase TrmN6
MTAQIEKTAAHPVLSSTSAQLFVSDIEASCNYFATKLGFAIDFVYGNPPFYGQVKRDNARLALSWFASRCLSEIFGNASICCRHRSPSTAPSTPRISSLNSRRQA